MHIDLISLWIVIVGAAMISFGTRASFILAFYDTRLPGVAQRALRFVPPAVFSALVAPELLLTSGSLNIGLENDKLLAGTAAALVAWRTRSTLATIIAGMLVLHGLRRL